jgi:hypothetical protein
MKVIQSAAVRSGLPMLLIRSLSALLVGGLCLAGSGRARAVELDAQIGFGPGSGLPSRYRPNSWTPVTIYLTGQGVNGVGQLQLSVRSGDRETIYVRRVPLHDGVLNETEHFVFLQHNDNGYGMIPGSTGTEITARLLVEGRKLAEKTLPLPASVNPETYNILALTRDGSGLNFLLKKRLGVVHRNVNPAVIARMNLQNGASSLLTTTQLLYTDPRALPEMGQGYDMIDAIALADMPTDSLTDDQQQALKEYVRRGGLLIVAGGGDMTRLKGQFLADLLPIQPTGAAGTTDFRALEHRYGQRVPLQGPSLVTQGTLKPDARALLEAGPGQLPFVSARPYGNGTVVYTTFDYLAPEFRAWNAAPQFWRDLLRSGNSALSPRTLLANMDDYGSGITTLADALAGRQAANTPSWWAITTFLGTYILLLVPGSYYLLKKLDKREYAWFTTPVLVLGFTVASYLIARSIKGGLLVVNRAVVLETQANTDQATGYAQMTLYSPNHTSYNITLGANQPDALYRDVTPTEIFQDQPGQLIVEHDKTTTLRDVLVKLWDKRSFDTPVLAQLGGQIQAQTQYLSGDWVRVIVTNKTRYTLKDCALIGAGNSASLGDLAPGATAQETMHWNHAREGVGLALPSSTAPDPNLVTGAAADPQAMARAMIREGMTQALNSGAQNVQNMVNQTYGGEPEEGYGRPVNAFVGWFYDPILDVQVNDQPPAGEQVNLLFAHLPTPLNAPVTMQAPTNPFAMPPPRTLEQEMPRGIFR